MKGYIGYTRVSTVKQGEGVSLEVQRDAITRYADQHHLSITVWLEEKETAAKQGRPMFTQAIRMLRGGKAQGIILHKLDRGARNLKDWAAIADLSDQGIQIHFVNESLDLTSRGGRLSADIQAVIAADYIRNLREETRKGFYGRLKQGIYPLQAPLGYVDNGSGKLKTIDPVKGSLVRRAFELYASAQYNLNTLAEEMYRLGLRNHNGGRVTRSGLSTLLNNPFYIGILRIKKSNQTFLGNHEPLIRKSLFDRVKAVLDGKTNAQTQRHDFAFKRLLTCGHCSYSLIGEKQKGHVYYRCHSQQCRGTSIREEVVEHKFIDILVRQQFSEDEKKYFSAKLLDMRKNWGERKDQELKRLNLQLAQIQDRLNRLTDAFLDGAIDREVFESRKTSLLMEQKTNEENMVTFQSHKQTLPERLETFLEFAGNAWLSHRMALPEEKREMVRIMTSNRAVTGKNVELKPSIPFSEIVNRFENATGGLERAIPRMWDSIIDSLIRLNNYKQLPDLSSFSELIHQNENNIREAG